MLGSGLPVLTASSVTCTCAAGELKCDICKTDDTSYVKCDICKTDDTSIIYPLVQTEEQVAAGQVYTMEYNSAVMKKKILPRLTAWMDLESIMLSEISQSEKDKERMALKQISSNKCFGGFQKVFEHDSVELRCKMKFAIYLPPQAETAKCPALYWLSGLACTEQNFILKSGFHQAASEHGLVVVALDTSPRGCNIEGEDDSWDFGTGAGFYVDATEEPWKTNYRMYAYVTQELPQLINANFPVDPQRMSVFGHSMGGHGALVCALKNPGKYRSVSAFAPICNPVLCPWGKKAFSGYLGADQSKWKAYDATHLVKSYPGSQLDILIDQGKDDQFLSDGQLLPDNFIAACTEKKIPVVFRLQEGYDHSYYFIATFIADHIRHHAKYLNA